MSAEQPGSSASETFVGRKRDLAAMRSALAAAIGGVGRVLLVSGEPGIGKTRLAWELARQANGRGVRVLWGSCGAGAEQGFRPWIRVLRDYVRARGAGIVSGELGEQAVDVARLVPELRPREDPAPLEDGPQSRVRLFDAVTEALRAGSRQQPQLIVLDDLHWADVPSLQLLRFVAREIADCRLLLVGTYRDVELNADHPLLPVIGSLTSQHEHISLTGLDESAVAELVRAVTGEEPERGLAATVVRETAGNPLFVREVARLVTNRGVLPARMRDDGGSGALLPRGVREVIDRRIGALPDGSADLLRVASVLGEEFTAHLAAAVGELSENAVRSLIGEAVRARLVEPVQAGLQRYRFVHALIRDVLYAGLEPMRRIELHRRAGAALEQRFADDLGPWLAELARHFRHGGTDPRDLEKAVEFSERAGRRALEMLAYEQAAEEFGHAVEIHAAINPADRARRCDLLLSLGGAHTAAGDLAAAREAFRAGADLAREAGDVVRIARAALDLGVEFTVGAPDPLELALLEEVRSGLPDDELALRARVEARLAKALLFSPNSRRRAALGERAVDLARRAGAPATLAEVLLERQFAVWGAEADPESRLATAAEVLRLAERTGSGVLAARGHALRLANLLEVGDMAAYDAEIDVYEQLTRRQRLIESRWQVPLLRATQALIAARFDDVERLAAEGADEGSRVDHPGAPMFVAAVLACARYWQGRVADNEAIARRMVDAFPSMPVWRSVLISTLAETGRSDEARAQLEWLAIDGFDGVPRDLSWLGSITTLAAACHHLGDAGRARVLYGLLLPYARYVVRVSRVGIGCNGPMAYHLGLLAATLRRVDDAAAHLDLAVTLGSGMRAPAFVANARISLAAVLLVRNGPGDRERAALLRDQAHQTARALGIRLHPDDARLGNPPPGDLADGVRRVVLHHEGDYWTMEFTGRQSRLKDTVGLRQLAQLVAEPGREFHVLDLATTGGSPRGGDAGPILDTRAKAAYRARLAELAADLEEAESFGDVVRAARAQAEIDALTEQLASAVGLGGRDRRAAADSERARSAVTKAIKSAIDRLTAVEPVLGGHLSGAVRTGTYCAYRPDPASTIRWEL